MGARGPKSAAELTAIGPGGVAIARRLPPPAELTEEQAETWRAIVNAHPAGWITAGSAPVLAQLCRHVTAARRVAAWIARLEADDGEFDGDLWLRLLARQEAEGRALAALATKLRLTPQARYTPKSAATAARPAPDGPRPWETEAAADD
jgi:hypothetical protein